jgi:hypothetical protein
MRRIIQISILVLSLTFSSYSQWWPFIEQNSGTSANLTSGSQPNWFRVWVCGYNGTVIKTSNYGMNWSNASGNLPSSIELVNIFAINDSVVLTVGNIGDTTFVYRSSNNGLNWARVFTQNDGYLDAIWMRTAATGFMMGDPVGGRWSLWKTTNAGLNWDSTGLNLPQAGSEYGYNNCLFCSQENIWFGTNNYRIYYSSNYGQSWQVQPTPASQTIRVIYRAYYFFGFFAGGSQLLETTNNGTNWTVVTDMPGTGNISGITEPNPGVINGPPNGLPIISRQNKVYIYNGWQLHWDTLYTAPANINYLFKSFQEPNNNWGGGCFALRTAGGIAVCACQLGNIKSIHDVIPQSYKLYQNYPNPFNPVTMIKFEIPEYADVKLIVYDVLGNEITVLANEYLKQGIYEIQWDASNQSSGVYFYKLITSQFTETKKMVLIK